MRKKFQGLLKPDLELTKKLIVDRKITWTSGIFLFKSKILIKR